MWIFFTGVLLWMARHRISWLGHSNQRTLKGQRQTRRPGTGVAKVALKTRCRSDLVCLRRTAAGWHLVVSWNRTGAGRGTGPAYGVDSEPVSRDEMLDFGEFRIASHNYCLLP